MCLALLDCMDPMDCNPPGYSWWDFPGKNSGVDCHAILQGIFLTLGENLHLLCLLHWQADSVPLVPPENHTWVYNPKELNAGTLTYICTPVFTVALFSITKKWKQSKCPLLGEWMNNVIYIYIYGLPWWLSGKEPACQCSRCGFDPWVGKIPRGRKWQLTPLYLPGKSHWQRSWVIYSSWDWKRVGHDLTTKQQAYNGILFSLKKEGNSDMCHTWHGWPLRMLC